MCEVTTAEYKEELSSKEETERQHQLLDAVFKKQEVVLHGTGFGEKIVVKSRLLPEICGACCVHEAAVTSLRHWRQHTRGHTPPTIRHRAARRPSFCATGGNLHFEAGVSTALQH
ncbi:uncharacterized protein LOC133545934 isoform X2 [Nerophis ophidion]|uniref:uncharacterized protein LOC133545934 isoform X2 n=1 Tax=Nerophis ophidion TaxID=159077 RepID=UPI002AE02F14|nr:uncharacterized protein LOC133545934 isoform X2 [Nerophis ophidion]